MLLTIGDCIHVDRYYCKPKKLTANLYVKIELSTDEKQVWVVIGACTYMSSLQQINNPSKPRNKL